NTPFSAESMKALGPIFGMPAEAIAPLTANAEMFKPILLRLAELTARDSYGATLIETGALDKADEQLTRAVELSSLFFGLLDGSTKRWRGMTARSRSCARRRIRSARCRRSPTAAICCCAPAASRRRKRRSAMR